jgi:glycosyltransferase involved in cell wall biosynthesis
MTRSSTHLVIIPAYNPGPRVREVVMEVLRHWQPVHVVVDGSTDGSERPLLELADTEPALTLQVLPRNFGKGAAVLAGALVAQARGFTHALVMDADGQHPAASIAEFMTASQQRPEAMILGQPVFPANMPAERRHGRKLSIGLVHFELLGRTVADPLFGFRVYPLEPLARVLGVRRGGRRYDFDTEAVVRLGWAGVPAVNRAAPVRYFSAAEGGVSHFHYVRDNVTLVWMHTRLITELLLWRWPALRRHRRAWRAAGLLVLCLAAANIRAADEDSLVRPENEVTASAPAWRELTDALARQPDTIAEFTERRHFPFKKEPVELQGEVRVSGELGLSLHYTAPEERIVILDAKGLLIRGPAGTKAPPADPRAAAANEALRRVLRFDFAALEQDFIVYGRRDGDRWDLALVARTDSLRRSVGRIDVTGEGTAVRHLEIRRSAKQAVVISMAVPRSPAPFTPEERQRYFR